MCCHIRRCWHLTVIPTALVPKSSHIGFQHWFNLADARLPSLLCSNKRIIRFSCPKSRHRLARDSHQVEPPAQQDMRWNDYIVGGFGEYLLKKEKSVVHALCSPELLDSHSSSIEERRAKGVGHPMTYHNQNRDKIEWIDGMSSHECSHGTILYIWWWWWWFLLWRIKFYCVAVNVIVVVCRVFVSNRLGWVFVFWIRRVRPQKHKRIPGVKLILSHLYEKTECNAKMDLF